jgi:hypothetical protein
LAIAKQELIKINKKIFDGFWNREQEKLLTLRKSSRFDDKDCGNG